MSGDALARRYRLLVRLSYPGEYRAARGDEIVATLLDCAGPRRRMPRPAEALDLFASGLRHRLGVGRIAGFSGGLTVAAPVALALAAGLSAFLLWRVEPVAGRTDTGGAPLFGAFRTTGPVAYATWLLAALTWAAAPRRRLARAATVVAITVTAGVVPLLAAFTPVDRPPLWVLMALTAFGVLALAGTGPAAGARSVASLDERLAVAAGAVAIAVSTSTVMVAPAPLGGGWGYYYEPTIARVGIVVIGAVVAVAVVALVRLVQRRPADDHVWAAALLGLPAGWLGPFRLDAAGGTGGTGFGRLAQVLLATSVAAATMWWLARRRAPGAPAAPRPPRRAMAVAGAAALGCAVGLAILLAPAWPDAFTSRVTTTLAVLAGVGSLAFSADVGGSRLPGLPFAATVGGASAALAMGAGWLVSAYGADWSVPGWAAPPATLVTTIAYLPLAWCAAAAAMVRSARAVVVLATSAGWLGVLTLPYLLSWAPAVAIFAACVAMRVAQARSAHMKLPNGHTM